MDNPAKIERTQELASLLLRRFWGRTDCYLSERRKKVDEPLTENVILDHLFGRDRIGVYQSDEGSSYVGFDFDGKNLPGGAQDAWAQLQKVANVIVMDLDLPTPIVERTRSQKGFRLLHLFDPDDAPSVVLAKQFGKLALRAADLPDDEKESVGHPGVYPHPAGPKGTGKTVFMPLGELLSDNGHRRSQFLELATRKPTKDQDAVLENTELVTRARLLTSLQTLKEMVGEVEPKQVVEATERFQTGTALLRPENDNDRWDALRREIMRLRNLLPEAETHVLVHALAASWGYDDTQKHRDAIEKLVKSAYATPVRSPETEFDREQRATRSGYEWKKAKSLYEMVHSEIKPIPWLIEGIVARDEICIITGMPKGLKTWLMIQLAISAVRGRDCMGLFGIDRPLRVTWIDEEMGHGKLERRFQRLCLGQGIEDNELREMSERLDIRPQQGLSLGNAEHLDAVRKAIIEHDADLVFGDSLIALQGGEENSATERRKFYNDCLAPLKTEFNIGLIFSAHPPLPTRDSHTDSQKRPRGSGDIVAQVDRTLWLKFAQRVQTESEFTVTSVLDSYVSREGEDIEPVTIMLSGLSDQPVKLTGVYAGSAEDQELSGKQVAVTCRIILQPCIRQRCETEGETSRNVA